jgi:hypothetical protein
MATSEDKLAYENVRGEIRLKIVVHLCIQQLIIVKCPHCEAITKGPSSKADATLRTVFCGFAYMRGFQDMVYELEIKCTVLFEKQFSVLSGECRFFIGKGARSLLITRMRRMLHCWEKGRRRSRLSEYKIINLSATETGSRFLQALKRNPWITTMVTKSLEFGVNYVILTVVMWWWCLVQTLLAPMVDDTKFTKFTGEAQGDYLPGQEGWSKHIRKARVPFCALNTSTVA